VLGGEPDAAARQSPASPPTEPSPPAHEQAPGGPGAAHVPFFGEAAGPRRRAEDEGTERGEAP
jgi:hypothetical protein